ncbi:hypothetical protein ACFV6F_28605 [Kitasatospora phosalacinea]|uniref:hypothetical protein n=1 Tax=Kitasatospora phosalacinea TaxID=2065 RepID=UPI003650A675
MDTMMHRQAAPDLDDLYARYAGRLRTEAAEQLAAIATVDTETLAEDLVEQVWEDVAAGFYPEGRRGLDGLQVLLRDKLRTVRARAAATSAAIREVVIDLDDLDDTGPISTIRTIPPIPATVSAAVAALRALPLAG